MIRDFPQFKSTQMRRLPIKACMNLNVVACTQSSCSESALTHSKEFDILHLSDQKRNCTSQFPVSLLPTGQVMSRQEKISDGSRRCIKTLSSEIPVEGAEISSPPAAFCRSPQPPTLRQEGKPAYFLPPLFI